MNDRCKNCGETRDAKEFETKWGTARCRSCRNAYDREWRAKNVEKMRAYEKVRRERRNAMLPPRPKPLTEEGRICRGCNQRLPHDRFHRHPDSRYKGAWTCIACMATAHQRTGKSRARAMVKSWEERAPASARLSRRKTQLKQKYGLTIERFDMMLRMQGGKCAVCLTELSVDGPRHLLNKAAIDHCHTTGRVRAILCVPCNAGLGSFQESESRLSAAISYLRQHLERGGVAAQR